MRLSLLLPMLLGLAVGACSKEPRPLPADGKTVHVTASGVRWRLTRAAGAVPNPQYEQSYVRVEQLGAADEVLQTFNFEERAWVRPDGAERTWVVPRLDDRGELEVVQHQLEPKAAERTVPYRWNGSTLAAPPSR